MYANGFLAEKRSSPVSLGAVIGLHAAALGAVILFGTTTFQKAAERRLIAVNITEPAIPPENPPPPPRPNEPTPRARDNLTVTDPVMPPVGPAAGPVTPPTTYHPPVTDPGPTRIVEANIPRIPEPVRHAAEVDPRFRDALQPPYPPDRERAQQDGRVRVRITIGTDGRVTAIDQLSTTHEAFWRATQRQALNRWRFRPATVDGRPVVSTMTMTVTFRIPDA